MIIPIYFEYFTGVGSRKTPIEFYKIFNNLSMILQSSGYILRSGGAAGADSYFELNNGIEEIYLPWYNFNNKKIGIITTDLYNWNLANKIGSNFHPNWKVLSNPSKKLIARDSYQVLGLDLNTPSKFIVCWTENGSISGGTGQALRIAISKNIPIYNFGVCKNEDEINNMYNNIIDNYIVKRNICNATKN